MIPHVVAEKWKPNRLKTTIMAESESLIDSGMAPKIAIPKNCMNLNLKLFAKWNFLFGSIWIKPATIVASLSWKARLLLFFRHLQNFLLPTI